MPQLLTVSLTSRIWLSTKAWVSKVGFLLKDHQYLNENYPDQFIIADAKRGDIGNTSAMYARTFFEEINLDAVTVALTWVKTVLLRS